MELNKDSQQNQEDHLHLNEYRHLLLSSTELMLPSQIDSNSRFSDFQLSIYVRIFWEINLKLKHLLLASFLYNFHDCLGNRIKQKRQSAKE